MIRRYDALTSLRFVAAFTVLLAHVVPAWAGVGTLAVPFFFALSGFVLFHADENVPAGLFYWKRFTKIAPLYYLSLLLHAPVFGRLIDPGGALFTPGKRLAAFAINASFLGAWLPEWLLLNPPGWTLSAEAFFYLLFPLLAPLARRIPKNAIFLSLALTVCAGAAMLKAAGNGDSILDFGYLSPVLHVVEFFAGVLLSRAYQEWRDHFSPTLVFSAGFVLLAGTAWPLATRWEPALHSFAGVPAFCLILWGAAGIKTGWLTSPRLVTLGEASYALYVLHWPLLDLAKLLMPGAAPGPFAGLMLVGMPVLSIYAHRWIEVPARRALLKIVRRSGKA